MATRIVEEYRGLLDPAWVRQVCQWNQFLLKASKSVEAAEIRSLSAGLQGEGDDARRELPGPIVIRKCDGIVLSGRWLLLAAREAGVEVIGTVGYADDGECAMPGTPPGLLPLGGQRAFRMPAATGPLADRFQALGIVVGGFLPAEESAS